MQVNEEKQEEIQGRALPSLKDIISPNTELDPNQNQINYEITINTRIVQPGQVKIEYTRKSRIVTKRSRKRISGNSQS